MTSSVSCEPLVSIITRTKDRPLTLNRLYETLSRQNFKKFEWVIVNDCGEQNCVDTIASKAVRAGISTKVLHNQTKKGRSYPVNLGVENAQGKYILIIDDDDYIHENYLCKMSNFLEKNNSFGAVACYTQVVIEEINTEKIKNIGFDFLYTPTARSFKLSNVFHGNPTPIHGIMIKKEGFIKAGGFPMDIEYTEDWCFWFKFCRINKVAVIPETLAYYSHRATKQSNYQNTAVNNDEGEKLHRKYEKLWKIKVFKELNKKELFQIIFNIKWKIQDTEALKNCSSLLKFPPVKFYHRLINALKKIESLKKIIIKLDRSL